MRCLGSIPECGLDVFSRKLRVFLEEVLNAQVGEASDDYGDGDSCAADTLFAVMDCRIANDSLTPIITGQMGLLRTYNAC